MLVVKSSRGLRLARTAVCALVFAGALASPALADTTVGVAFYQQRDGHADVNAGTSLNGVHRLRLDLVRGGTVIATSGTSASTFFPYGDVPLASLLAGDVANVYIDGAFYGAVTYDGLPAINGDACLGRSSFTAARAANASVQTAGAFTPGTSPYADPYADDTRAIWSKDNPVVVTLDRPLAAGQVAFVGTYAESGRLGTYSEREIAVGPCPAPPVVVTPVKTTTTTTTTTPAPPTDAQVLQAVKAALTAAGAKLRTLHLAKLARQKSVALSFAFPEAGTAKLQLTTKAGKNTVVVGTGSKTVTSKGVSSVTVKLTSAGRKALKHAKKLKLTLKGAFTPARPGARAQTTSASLTLKK